MRRPVTLTLLVAAMGLLAFALVSLAANNHRLRQRVADLETKLKIIDPTQIPGSRRAFVVRPSGEMAPWRICFAGDCLEEPTFPDRVKDQVERIRQEHSVPGRTISMVSLQQSQEFMRKMQDPSMDRQREAKEFMRQMDARDAVKSPPAGSPARP